MTRRNSGGFCHPDSRSKTACWATPASASGGGYSEQGLAQRSKKSRKSGSPKIFSGTARGVAKQLRALLPLPRKRHLRKQVPFSVKSTLRVEEIPFGDDPPVGIKSLRRWVDLISSAKRISSTTQISSLREQGFHYKEIAGLFQLNPPIFDGF